MKRRVALERIGGAQHRRFVEGATRQLETDRQAFGRRRNRTGTLIDGSPVRLALTVKMSFKYICTGSLVFSPSLNAGVGVVGVATTSTRSKARS